MVYRDSRDCGYAMMPLMFVFLLFFMVLCQPEEGKTMDYSKSLLKINQNSVGPVTIGKPIPEKLLTRGIEERYIAGYFADAQPYEGFQLQYPPVTVLLDRGPFMQKAKSSMANPAEKGLPQKALMTAKKGAKVKMIIVESKDVKTDAGVGIGSDLNALKSVYHDLKVNPVPTSFGNDECVAYSQSLPNVYFYFHTCKSAKDGEGMTRILLF